MRIEPLLAYVIASQSTGKKITTLTHNQSGEQYSYTYGDQVYDYKHQSYWKISRKGTETYLNDYQTNYYYTIQSKSSGIYTAHREGTEEFYEITINRKWIVVMNQKTRNTHIFYF